MKTSHIIGLISILMTTLHLALSLPVVMHTATPRAVPIMLRKAIYVTQVVAIGMWAVYAYQLSDRIILSGMSIAFVGSAISAGYYLTKKQYSR